MEVETKKESFITQRLLTVSDDGDVFVSDTGNNRIQVFV